MLFLWRKGFHWLNLIRIRSRGKILIWKNWSTISPSSEKKIRVRILLNLFIKNCWILIYSMLFQIGNKFLLPSLLVISAFTKINGCLFGTSLHIKKVNLQRRRRHIVCWEIRRERYFLWIFRTGWSSDPKFIFIHRRSILSERSKITMILVLFFRWVLTGKSASGISVTNKLRILSWI